MYTLCGRSEQLQCPRRMKMSLKQIYQDWGSIVTSGNMPKLSQRSWCGRCRL